MFIGIGLPEAKVSPVFENLTNEMGYYTSKIFLPQVSQGSKPGKTNYFISHLKLLFSIIQIVTYIYYTFLTTTT